MELLKRVVEKMVCLLSISIVIPLNSPEVGVNYILISVRGDVLSASTVKTDIHGCFRLWYMQFWLPGTLSS